MPRKATGSKVEWSPTHKAWCTRVRETVIVEGKPTIVRKRVPIIGATSQAHAERLAGAVVEGRKANAVAPGAPASGETFEAWAKRWCDAREARKLSTVPNDRGYVRNHYTALHGVPVAAITTADVERVVGELDAKVRAGDISAHTAANAWGTLTQMFTDARSAKVVPGVPTLRVRKDNPTTDVAGPDRGDKKSKVFLYPNEFLKLVSCRDVNLEFRRLIAADVYLYLRASELGALDLEDCDEEHNAAHVHRALDRYGKGTKALKGKEARRPPIDPALVPLIRAIRAERNSGRLFPDMPRVDKLAVMLREALKVAGITRAELFADASDATRKPMTFHDLRATGITWAAIRGDEPLKIQTRAGHKSFDTTAGYVRMAENLAAGFGAVFPPLPPELFPKVRTGSDRDARKLAKTGCGQQDLNPLGSVSPQNRDTVDHENSRTYAPEAVADSLQLAPSDTAGPIAGPIVAPVQTDRATIIDALTRATLTPGLEAVARALAAELQRIDAADASIAPVVDLTLRRRK